MIISLALAIVIGIVHLYNEKITIHGEKLKNKLVSLVAGASVTYAFLFLLPELYQGVGHLKNPLFFSVLVGFVVIHVTEKYAYQHERPEKIFFKLKEIHSIAFFVYYLILGVVLTKFIREDLLNGILLFIPILFYATISSVSLDKLHPQIVRNKMIIRLILSSSVIFGVLASSSIISNSTLFHTLLGLAIGAFMYIVVRDFIPKESRGDPLYFLLGTGFYSLLIVLSWQV